MAARAASSRPYTGYMYGYQPPQEDPQGSWREVFAITRVAFEVLAKPLALLMGTIGLFIMFLWAAFTNPVLILIPGSLAALGIWYLVRQDRKAHRALEDEILGEGRRNV